MRVTLKILYSGELLHGEMESLATSDAIRGSTEFLSLAAKTVYGSDAVSRGRVTAFKASSFEIQQIIDISRESVALAATVLPVFPPIENVKPFLALIKDAFALLKHLGGEKPKKVNFADNGSVVVESNNGTVNIYNGSTVNFILQTDASGASQKFIGQQIGTEADRVSIKIDDESVLEATKKDAPSFRDVTVNEAQHISRQEVILRVVGPVLEGNAQWRFNDGGRTFPAKIEDEGFLKRVSDGLEGFSKGDRVRARMRTEQYLGPRRGLKMKYYVEDILGRYIPPEAPELPLG